MEIERKFLISKENLPADLNSYPHHRLEQGYLSTAPEFVTSSPNHTGGL